MLSETAKTWPSTLTVVDTTTCNKNESWTCDLAFCLVKIKSEKYTFTDINADVVEYRRYISAVFRYMPVCYWLLLSNHFKRLFSLDISHYSYPASQPFCSCFLVSCICVQLIDFSITKIPFPFTHSSNCHHSWSSELLISLSIYLRMEGLPFKILLESLAVEPYSIPSLNKHFTRIRFQATLHIS